MLLFWARMLLIVIDQAFQHRHTLKRDRGRWFVHPLPSHLARVMVYCAAMMSVTLLAAPQTREATGQPRADPPLPDIRLLMQEVQEHQKQLDKVRESCTYTSLQTRQDIDGNGQLKKTETEEDEVFFVNGHVIERTVKKNGQPLSDHDQQKRFTVETQQAKDAEVTLAKRP